jgi:drug/metabolite transporter (DMT)-like permease
MSGARANRLAVHTIERVGISLDRAHAGLRAGMRCRVIQGAALMLLSLALVLLINALARELMARYPAGEVLFSRFFGSVLVLGALSAGRLDGVLQTRRPGIHLLRAVLGVGAMLALFLSLRHLPFADLMAISYSSPLMVAAMSWRVLGEHIGLSRRYLLGAGTAGVLVVAFPGRIDAWSLGALAMAGLNAGAMLATRRLGRSDGAATVALYFAVFGSLLTAPLLFFGFALPTLFDTGLFGVLGLGAGLAARCHAEAFRRADASVIAPIDYLAVALSPVIAWFAWGEIPSLAMLTGGSVIIVAGILQLRAARRELLTWPRPASGAIPM